MIAQLMAQRALSLNPSMMNAGVYRSAVKLCANADATIAQLARMQALMTKLPRCDVNDLCQQALGIRRAQLQREEDLRSRRGFRLEIRARLAA